MVPVQAEVVTKQKEWISSYEVEPRDLSIRERRGPALC